MHRFEVGSITTKVEMATFPPWNNRHSGEGEVVDDQVRRPGDKLVADQFRKHTNGHIFHKVYGFRNELGPRFTFGYPVLFDIRNERDVLVDVVGNLVVESMRNSPGVEGDE